MELERSFRSNFDSTCSQEKMPSKVLKEDLILVDCIEPHKAYHEKYEPEKTEEKHIKLLNNLYITDNKKLFSLYFCARKTFNPTR